MIKKRVKALLKAKFKRKWHDDAFGIKAFGEFDGLVFAVFAEHKADIKAEFFVILAEFII